MTARPVFYDMRDAAATVPVGATGYLVVVRRRRGWRRVAAWVFRRPPRTDVWPVERTA